MTYRVGIIGCGRIAGFLEDDPLRGHPCTHIGAYREDADMEVVACCSRNELHARRFAERFSVPRFYTDYRDMLGNERFDVVSVATYAPSHCAITCAAAEQGAKVIFCEKAMATSLHEADAMIETCKRHQAHLIINHTRRWEYDYQYARRLIDEGGIGVLKSLRGSFSGNIFHTGIHMLDCMLYFAGPARTVWGRLSEGEEGTRAASGYQFQSSVLPVEDKDGVATIEFENGVMGQVMGLGRSYFGFELIIDGSEGSIRVGNGVCEYWRMEKSKKYTGFQELVLQKRSLPEHIPSAYVAIMNDIKNALLFGQHPRSTGVEARQSLEIACAIYESHARKGAAVDLPLCHRKRRVISR